MLSLVEICSVVLEKKILKFRKCVFSLFHNYLPLEKGGALHLNKLESPSSKDALCQVWLKLAQWFWRRRWKCEKFTDGRTDGQTDDGRQVIRKAHLSFQLRWAKKREKKIGCIQWKWDLWVVEPLTFYTVSVLTLSKVVKKISIAAVFQSVKELLCWPDLEKSSVVFP